MDKIIERVQKLLALAGNNPNENEALAALEKAHAILAEHNLTMAEVPEAGQAEREDEKRGHVNVKTKMPERYFAWVWNAVCKAHYCACIYSRPSSNRYDTYYAIVGRRVNVVISTHMALYLCQTMKRVANEAAKAAGRKDSQFKTAFLTGMAERICARVADMTRKDAATGNALVLWSGNEQAANDAYLDGIGTERRASRSVETRLDSAGYRSGKEAGDRVSLAAQVGGARAAPALPRG